MSIESIKELCKYFNDFKIELNNNYDGALYHYTSLPAFESIIHNKTLRFSNRHYLNDYSEGKYVLDLCIKHIDEICPDDDTYKAKFNAKCNDLKEKMEDNIFNVYIACFSTKKDSLIMWNYYSQNGGLCLEFNNKTMTENMYNKLTSTNKKQFVFQYGLVIYEKERQLEIIKNIVEQFYNKYKQSIRNDWIFCTLQKIIFYGAFFKHVGFSDEREYRIAFDLAADNGTFYAIEENNEKCIMRLQNRHGMIVPYVDLSFEADTLKGVMISPLASIDKNKLKSWMPEEFKDIDIRNSEIPLRY